MSVTETSYVKGDDGDDNDDVIDDVKAPWFCTPDDDT